MINIQFPEPLNQDDQHDVAMLMCWLYSSQVISTIECIDLLVTAAQLLCCNPYDLSLRCPELYNNWLSTFASNSNDGGIARYSLAYR